MSTHEQHGHRIEDFTGQSFTERAEAIREQAVSLKHAPLLTKMAAGQEVATEAALLVADMAVELDALMGSPKPMTIEEVREKYERESG